jgi:hypothetical protein
MLANALGRRTQVVKGEVCKTSMQRFESARRLHFASKSFNTGQALYPKKIRSNRQNTRARYGSFSDPTQDTNSSLRRHYLRLDR